MQAAYTSTPARCLHGKEHPVTWPEAMQPERQGFGFHNSGWNRGTGRKRLHAFINKLLHILGIFVHVFRLQACVTQTLLPSVLPRHLQSLESFPFAVTKRTSKNSRNCLTIVKFIERCFFQISWCHESEGHDMDLTTVAVLRCLEIQPEVAKIYPMYF
jgi:hypothetical protein